MSLLGNITVSLSNTSTSSTGTISQTVAGGSLSNTTNLNGSSLTELSGNVTQITGQQINFGSTGNDTNINITGKINSSNDIITQGSFYSYSDERLKKNIHPIENTLDKVDKLNGVYYEWKDGRKNVEIGLIAQEVQEQFPEIVKTDQDGILTVDYSRLSVILIESIKDLKKQIQKL